MRWHVAFGTWPRVTRSGLMISVLGPAALPEPLENHGAVAEPVAKRLWPTWGHLFCNRPSPGGSGPWDSQSISRRFLYTGEWPVCRTPFYNTASPGYPQSTGRGGVAPWRFAPERAPGRYPPRARHSSTPGCWRLGQIV